MLTVPTQVPLDPTLHPVHSDHLYMPSFLLAVRSTHVFPYLNTQPFSTDSMPAHLGPCNWDVSRRKQSAGSDWSPPGELRVCLHVKPRMLLSLRFSYLSNGAGDENETTPSQTVCAGPHPVAAHTSGTA